MRAFSVVIIAFAAVSAVALAVPVAEDIPSEYLRQENDTDVVVDEPLQVDTIESLAPVENGGRFRRATCDLLSVDLPFIKVNHAACAAHCLAMRKGYKGGYCKRAVCHCRR